MVAQNKGFKRGAGLHPFITMNLQTCYCIIVVARHSNLRQIAQLICFAFVISHNAILKTMSLSYHPSCKIPFFTSI